MTREEQIKNYAINNCIQDDIDDASYELIIETAEWADETMLDKVCEWLKDNFVNGREIGCDAGAMHKNFKSIEEIIPSFIKSMEK